MLVMFEHPWNMFLASVSTDVLNDEMSSSLSDEHERNIYCMVVTLDVSKWERSTEVNAEHVLNILAIDATFDMLRFSMPVMEVAFFSPLK